MDSALYDQIETDDQAGELDSYMMQKWVLDTATDPVRADCDHPGDSVEVINAIYNDGNETTEPESVPNGRSKGMSAAVPDLVKAVVLNSVSGALRYNGNSLVTKNGRSHGAPFQQLLCHQYLGSTLLPCQTALWML